MNLTLSACARKANRGRKRKQRITMVTVAVAAIVVIFISNFIVNSMLSQTVDEPSQLRAAIVDQLSLTFPNQTFVETATSILEQAGYAVDYYPGENVTVEFYRNLPTHGYNMVILRVHSTATGLKGKECVEIPVCLFTSEYYSPSRYVYEQLTGQLDRVIFDTPQSSFYFLIRPDFVASGMKGKFRNAFVIMMGCQGLTNTKMAEAFTKKGAEAYISWNNPVSSDHTDQATVNLLKHLVLEQETLRQAVEDTMREVGADQTYNSLLAYYPPQAGDLTTENAKGKD